MDIRYDIFLTQYRKVRDTIVSVNTIGQLKSAKRMLSNLSNWWVSDVPMHKPFYYKSIDEPIIRLGELESLVKQKEKSLDS